MQFMESAFRKIMCICELHTHFNSLLHTTNKCALLHSIRRSIGRTLVGGNVFRALLVHSVESWQSSAIAVVVGWLQYSKNYRQATTSIKSLSAFAWSLWHRWFGSNKFCNEFHNDEWHNNFDRHNEKERWKINSF